MAILIGRGLPPTAVGLSRWVAVAERAITSARERKARTFSFRKRERDSRSGSPLYRVGHDAWADWTSRWEAELVAWRRATAAGRTGPFSRPRGRVHPETEQAVGGQEHDDEEDDPDQRVEGCRGLKSLRSRSPVSARRSLMKHEGGARRRNAPSYAPAGPPITAMMSTVERCAQADRPADRRWPFQPTRTARRRSTPIEPRRT